MSSDKDKEQEKVSYIALMGEINANSAEKLMKVVSGLSEQTKTIYLLFATSGGSVPHGFAIYNFLRALPYKIIIHNIGNVDSIGNVIFLAGDERYATEYALFLYHRVKVDPKLKLIDLSFTQEKLDGIKKDEYRIGEIYKERTHLSEDEVKSFFNIGEFKNARTALDQGIIHDIRDLPKIKKVVVVEVGESEMQQPSETQKPE